MAFSQDLWMDTLMVGQLKTGIHAIYNFEFEKAEAIQKVVIAQYPKHPAVLMYEALLLNWKYYPLQAGSPNGDKFESLCLQSLSASEPLLEKYPAHQLTQFFAMMPRMMLLEFYADNGLGVKTIPYLTSVYRSVVNGFEYCKSTPEFYFTTGLYNYYRVAYPEANPFYKPIVSFFPGGNKELGLNDLYECWKTSGFIGPEAMSFLCYIYTNFENNPDEGVKYTSELIRQYPNNPYFAQHHVHLLLLDKQYALASVVVAKYKDNPNMSVYFHKVFQVFDAIINEHIHENLAKSEATYVSTISSMDSYGNYARRYIAYAYFGLSRIKKAKGMITEANQCREMGKKVAQYPNVTFD